MAVESWPPTRYTPPLSPDFPSHGDRLIQFAELAWTTPENPKGLQLDPWQREFIRAVLEVYPAGHPRAGELRYRQVVLSVARQAGKSTLASIFVFYGLLMHVAGPYVLGIASSQDQARIIYDRVLYAIASKPELKALFAKLTETRGIRTADGSGRYEIKAAKGAALQGLPVSLVLFDELHISKPEMWGAVVEGMKTKVNGLIIGITTAGSPDSTLLLDLYARGAQAIAGDDERFGFFVYEAPEGAALDDPDAYRAANPALACGRLDLETVMNDVRGRPEPDVRRYSLNQFTTSSDASWLAPYVWSALPTQADVFTPTHVAVAVSQGQEWATLTFGRKDGTQVRTAVFCHISNPSVDRLAEVCEAIARKARVTFVMEGTQKALVDRLRARRHSVEFFNLGQMATAATTTFRKIMTSEVIHDHSELTGVQMGRGTWKTTGGVNKLIPIAGNHIDAVLAQTMVIFAADTAIVPGLGIYAR